MNGHVYRTIAEQFGEQAALSLCLQMLFRWLTAACSITLVTAHQAPTKGKGAWRNMLLWVTSFIGSAAYAYVQNEATFLRLSSLCLLYAGLVGAVYLLFERSLADSLISAAAGLLTAYFCSISGQPSARKGGTNNLVDVGCHACAYDWSFEQRMVPDIGNH